MEFVHETLADFILSSSIILQKYLGSDKHFANNYSLHLVESVGAITSIGLWQEIDGRASESEQFQSAAPPYQPKLQERRCRAFLGTVNYSELRQCAIVVNGS